jgi:hypothetical protein
MGDHEMPGIQPVTPEERIPSDPSATYEIRRGIIDGMDKEEEEDRARLGKIEEIIRKRDHADLSGDPDSAAYRSEAVRGVEEAKREIDRIARLIGVFGERSFLDRILHHSEYRELQAAYDAAIREEHNAEERLRISGLAMID